jgi:hypothetical protein
MWNPADGTGGNRWAKGTDLVTRPEWGRPVRAALTTSDRTSMRSVYLTMAPVKTMAQTLKRFMHSVVSTGRLTVQEGRATARPSS